MSVPTAEPYWKEAKTSACGVGRVVLIVVTGFLAWVVFAAAPRLLVLLREPGSCGRLSGALVQGERLDRVDELLAPVHENGFYLPVRLVAVAIDVRQRSDFPYKTVPTADLSS